HPSDDRAPGLAYFAVAEQGVALLRDQAWFPVELPAPGGSTWRRQAAGRPRVVEMTTGLDGVPYVLTNQAIYRLEGTRAKHLADTWSHEPRIWATHVAVTTNGELWTGGTGQVAHHDGSTWTVETTDFDVNGIAIDGTGLVWLATETGAFRREGSGWEPVVLDGGATGAPGLSGASTEPASGSVIVWGRRLAVQVRGRRPPMPLGFMAGLPTPTEAAPEARYDHIGASASGYRVASFSHGRHIVRIEPDGTMRHDGSGTDFEGLVGCGFICVNPAQPRIEIDTQGRAWLATDAGLAVLGPAETRAFFPMSSMPALTGEVEAMLVLGDGPRLPPARPIRTAGLRGRLMSAQGEPLRRMPFDLCPRPELAAGSPCATSSLRTHGASDQDGEFSLDGVVMASYQLCTLGKVHGCVRLGRMQHADVALELGDVVMP
ncbi:MAG: hypothetical protein K0V04_34365, partial [Deltaproteobacteria bacterium]|nr:hypothetical protein [Deltaproteobacteria bacterium]